MPPYAAEPSVQTYPPFTISAVSPGIPNYSWGSYTPYADAPNLNVEHAETFPANGTAGKQFALWSFAGTALQQAREIFWEVQYPGGAPATVDVRLQGAMRDVEAEYYDIDSTTNVLGEKKQVGIFRVNFLRIKVVASTGSPANLIAKFII
jgi:hypothetical protein